MIKAFKTTCLSLALCAMSLPALAQEAKVGTAAPDFTAADIKGQSFHLSEHKGEIVVLEWTNDQCPFVKKHYNTGNMQKTQGEAIDKGVTWVSIISSAPGRQGHVSDAEALKIAEEKGSKASNIIRDESGDIGHLYDAKTTPHMFVIDKEGILVYAGAIDNNSSPREATIEGATNYVHEALSALEKGEMPAVSETAPYGCGVKY